MEEIRCSGIWWLPSAPETHVYGEFTFSNREGLHLSSIGTFEDTLRTAVGRSYPVILGATSDGKRITLCDCMVVGHTGTGAGVETQRYSVDMALIGAHIDDPQEMRFHRVSMQYSHLADWFCPSGFRPRSIEAEDASRRYELSYELPERIVAATTKGRMTVWGSVKTAFSVREASLQQSVWITFEIPGKQRFEDLNSQLIHPLRNLVTLATDRPNSITQVFVFSKRHAHTSPIPSDIVELPIEVLFRTSYDEMTQTRALTPGEMLFSFEDVESDFEQLVQRWLVAAEELDSVCDLFFSNQYNPGMYLENKFLNLAQAAESYHRRRRCNQSRPAQEHERRLEAVFGACPAKHKKWLEWQLKYSNEPSFKERLLDLIDVTGETMLPLVQDAESFACDVRDSRNYYVHYDSSLRQQAAQGEKLYRLTERLAFLMRACLLCELGFTPQRCAKLFNNNQRYQYAVGRK